MGRTSGEEAAVAHCGGGGAMMKRMDSIGDGNGNGSVGMWVGWE